MKVDLKLVNGTIVTSTETFDGGIAIDNEKIVAISEERYLPSAKRVIDVRGNYILPGLIDAHVHFRDPGMEYKEDYKSGSIAAAFGGITLVCDMPNTFPPADNRENLDIRRALIKEKSLVDVAVFGLISPGNIDRIGELRDAGVIGYKIYLGESFGDVQNLDDGGLVQAFERVTKTGLRIGFHAEDNNLLGYFLEKVKDTGKNDLSAFLESRPEICEVESILKVALLSKYLHTKIHILHVSSKDGAEVISDCKRKGIDITAETCPHYLFLSMDEHMEKVGSVLRANPPIRSCVHGKYLFESLLDGTIDFLTTDHAPHSFDEKVNKDIWKVNSGVLGVETASQVMLSEAVVRRGMSLNKYVQITSENPAKTWGLWPQKGSLQIGSHADITIVDLNKKWRIVDKELHSRSQVTPWNNWEGIGKPITTIVRGRPVIVDEELIENNPAGKFIGQDGIPM